MISSFRNIAEAWSGYLLVHAYSLALIIKWDIDAWKRERDGKRSGQRDTEISRERAREIKKIKTGKGKSDTFEDRQKMQINI